MIAETLEQGYVPNYKEGNKAAVFVASTDMATALVKFRVRFPGIHANVMLARLATRMTT